MSSRPVDGFNVLLLFSLDFGAKKRSFQEEAPLSFFFLCALQLFLVPRTLGTGRKPRSKLNCWLFFGSYLVLPSFLSRIPGFHNQNGLVPGRTGSWNTRTFRGLVPNWSRVPIIVTGFFFCCYLVFPGFLNHFPTETASFHEISSWNEAPNPGLTRSFNHRYRVFFFTEFFPQVSISNFFP